MVNMSFVRSHSILFMHAYCKRGNSMARLPRCDDHVIHSSASCLLSQVDEFSLTRGTRLDRTPNLDSGVNFTVRRGVLKSWVFACDKHYANKNKRLIIVVRRLHLNAL